MWKKFFWISLVLFFAIIFVAYFNMLPYQEFTQKHDKILHFLVFGGVGWLGFRAFPKKYRFQYFSIPAFPFWLAVFSIAEEFMQKFYPHRTFSMMDLLANFLGIGCFYLIDKWLFTAPKIK